MCIGLMSYIKNDLIPGSGENTVKRYRKLHRPEVGRKMTSGTGDIFYQKCPYLLAKLLFTGKVKAFHKIRGYIVGKKHLSMFLSFFISGIQIL